jgi:hypothetical protein
VINYLGVLESKGALALLVFRLSRLVGKGGRGVVDGEGLEFSLELIEGGDLGGDHILVGLGGLERADLVALFFDALFNGLHLCDCEVWVVVEYAK